MRNDLATSIVQWLSENGDVESKINLFASLDMPDLPEELRNLIEQALNIVSNFSTNVAKYKDVYNKLSQKREEDSLPSLETILLTMGMSNDQKAVRLKSLTKDISQFQWLKKNNITTCLTQIHKLHEEHKIWPFELQKHPSIMEQNIKTLQKINDLTREDAKSLFQLGADHWVFWIDEEIESLKNILRHCDDINPRGFVRVGSNIIKVLVSVVLSMMFTTLQTSDPNDYSHPLKTWLLFALVFGASFVWFSKLMKLTDDTWGPTQYDEWLLLANKDEFLRIQQSLQQKWDHLDKIKTLDISFDEWVDTSVLVKQWIFTKEEYGNLSEEFILQNEKNQARIMDYLSLSELWRLRLNKKITSKMIEHILKKKALIDRVARVKNKKLTEIMDTYIKIAELDDAEEQKYWFWDAELILKTIFPQYDTFEKADIGSILQLLSIFMDPENGWEYSFPESLENKDQPLDLEELKLPIKEDRKA